MADRIAKYPCPCCGYLTLVEKPPGTYAICPVCFWEDDPIQFADHDYDGGANRISLRQARDNFAVHGVSEPRHLRNVRFPREDEKPSSIPRSDFDRN
jgi:hypothetical protein